MKIYSIKSYRNHQRKPTLAFLNQSLTFPTGMVAKWSIRILSGGPLTTSRVILSTTNKTGLNRLRYTIWRPSFRLQWRRSSEIKTRKILITPTKIPIRPLLNYSKTTLKFTTSAQKGSVSWVTNSCNSKSSRRQPVSRCSWRGILGVDLLII